MNRQFVDKVQGMRKKDGPTWRRVSLVLILSLFLCTCWMMMFAGPHSFDLMGGINEPAFEHHHLVEFEEEVFLFTFFVFIGLSAVAEKIYAARQKISLICHFPHLPPPKTN